MTTAYPLAWPDGWPRTPPHVRESGVGRFVRGGSIKRAWTFAEARDALVEELDRLRVSHIVISTNFPLRRDGLPMAGTRVDDQGVAVYFLRNKKPMAMACDRFTQAEFNMRSLTLAIEAMRQLDRHGGGIMTERAFSGFAALPAPTEKRTWHVVLGISATATPDEIRAAHRAKVADAHPDRGGTDADMAEINVARDEGLRARALT